MIVERDYYLNERLFLAWLDTQRPGVRWVETFMKDDPNYNGGGYGDDGYRWYNPYYRGTERNDVPQVEAQRCVVGSRRVWRQRGYGATGIFLTDGVILGEGTDHAVFAERAWAALSESLGHDPAALAIVREWTENAIEGWAYEEAEYEAARAAEEAALAALDGACARARALKVSTHGVYAPRRSESADTDALLQNAADLRAAAEQIDALAAAEEARMAADEARFAAMPRINVDLGSGKKCRAHVVAMTGIVDRDGGEPSTWGARQIEGYAADPAWSLVWTLHYNGGAVARCLATAAGRGFLYDDGEFEGSGVTAAQVRAAHGLAAPKVEAPVVAVAAPSASLDQLKAKFGKRK